MRAAIHALRCLTGAVVFASPLAAQQNIPIRTVKPDGRVAESFSSVAAIKQFRTGELLVDDATALRIVLFDKTLAHRTLVADTSGAAADYGRIPYAFINASPDTVFLIDVVSRTLVTIGASGKLGRAVAAPKPNDLQFAFVSQNPLQGPNGGAYIDAKGRIVYRGLYPQGPPPPPVPGKPIIQEQPDTAPLVRGDFDTRKVDTIARVKIARPFKAIITPNPNGPSTGTLVAHPLQVADGWTVLADGTIAIVRAQDYHIDWIDPDGTARSTPKMPFAWRRLTETEKKYFADSAIGFWKHIADSIATVQKARGNTAGGGPTSFDADTPDQMPDYLSPIGGVWPDADNHLWILPTTSADAKGGLLYDVVDRTGTIIERVQLPSGAQIAGFGAQGAVYITRREANGMLALERVQIER
jgi:hypothetical protein